MDETRAKPIPKIEPNRVMATTAAEAHSHDAATRRIPEASAAVPVAATPAAESVRETTLAFQVNPRSDHVHVQVVDPDTGDVLRSFSVSLPGRGENADAPITRGAIVDAKA